MTFAQLAVLQRAIIRPITTLAEATEHVRTRSDYGQQVPAAGDDELGMGRGLVGDAHGVFHVLGDGAGHEKEVKRYATTTCAGVAGKREKDKVTVVGVVSALRERMISACKLARSRFMTMVWVKCVKVLYASCRPGNRSLLRED